MEGKGKSAKRTRRLPFWEASERDPVCKMSVYLAKLANEKAAASDATAMTWHAYVRRIAALVVSQAFVLSSRISQQFERPTDCKKSADFIEEISSGRYICRLYLNHPTLPQAFKVQFGPQNGLSPGSATCGLNATMNAEEQSITKREWRRCLSDDLCLSAETIFPWFSQEMFRVLDFLKEKNYEEEFTDAIFWKLFPGVQLFLPIPNKIPKASEKPHFGLHVDSQIELLFVPCIMGTGWPGGVKIQHAFPKQKLFVAKGTESLQHLAQLVEDGQGYALWVLEPTPKQAVSEFPVPTFWLSRKRGILGKEDPTQNKLPIWQVSLRPAIRILRRDLVAGLKEDGFGRDVDIDAIQSLVLFFKAQHDWLIFDNDVINSAILCCAKRHLVGAKTTAAMFVKVIAFLGKVARTRSCPSFLMPNLNILRVSDVDEVDEVATNVKAFLAAMEQDDTHLLKYLGYKSRTELQRQQKKKTHST